MRNPSRFALLQNFGTILLVLFLSSVSPAQRSERPNRPTSAKIVEVTQEDFTKIAALRSTNLTVFGIRLGQTEDEAKTAAQSAGLTWKAGSRDFQRELYDSNGNILITLGFADGVVMDIALQRYMAAHLKGDSATLLSESALEPTSSNRLSLLGHEDEYVHNDLGSSGESRKYRYFKEGIEVHGFANSPGELFVVVSFFSPAKER